MDKKYVDVSLAPWYLNKDGCEMIKRMPAADVQEVRHGRWIVTNTEFAWNNGEFPTEWRCSHCNNVVFEGEPPYCPYCGAKMDGG